MYIITILTHLLFLSYASLALSIEPTIQNNVTITSDNNYRYIKSNSIPDHNIGKFPNRRNPNSIAAQNFNFRIPLTGKKTGRITPLGFSPFGIALNGVLFDPAAAEFWNNDRNSGWNYDALSGKIDLGFDQQNAHIQPNGTYHYHGIAQAFLRKSGKKPYLVGYAADGFPIYLLYGKKNGKIKKLTSSYQLKSATRRSGPGGKYDGTFVEDYEYVENSGDLDQCNGYFGITNEYPKGTYYYVLTENFPNIPRCFVGTPDISFSKKTIYNNRKPHRKKPPHAHRPPHH